ncbi:cobalamin biosynthesis protein CobQ [Hylemonella gracilis str. Niagara R]|uniref:Cobyric acid synthase n=1 Tax=Hylemonella gracilis str. Niagara R TaxID=1458275 RepID=A0A016XI48_9BURK|nr:cobyric acid synthase [Hylemonella gracilis]EYC51535.1 cobalamin biosynthesis protein CobQ [Hylemonella gracilis str. Niagara R]
MSAAAPRARAVMVLGTTSGAGKSWLTTALCRHYARLGLKVAPFKAQNMSNNARVVAPALGKGVSSLPTEGAALGLGAARRPNAGGEIGSAQYFQALAARAEPEVRMNPLLLKPERDTHSQVVLLGQVDEALTRLGWRGRSEKVWPTVARALDELMAENDVVVIEGAGSPAEINLMDSDIVNLRVARHARARCLLVTDIDRGGAFAHLYGTWALLPEADRALICGFVLNKFRGDAALLAPGPQQLQALTGVPTVATLPMWWQHGLPEEDGMFDMAASQGGGDIQTRIAVVAYPRISNLDEFQPLKNVPGVALRWARGPADLVDVDWVILPGSKHTSGDLAWLRAQGLDRAIAAHAAQGKALLGVCGGLQMLGEALIDTHGIDGNAPGLGLLPLVTAFEPAKTVRRTAARFGTARGAWAALSGVGVQGYEIHHGQTVQHPAMAAAGNVATVLVPGLAWQNEAGNVLGVYLHGLFEDAAVLQALFGARVPTLDSVFERMADFIEQHFEPGVLDMLIAD